MYFHDTTYLSIVLSKRTFPSLPASQCVIPPQSQLLSFKDLTVSLRKTMDTSKLEECAIVNLPPSEYDKSPSPPTCYHPDSTSTSQSNLHSQPHSYSHLITYDELPTWQKDNPSIHASYRPLTHSLPASLKTFFTLHNETLNIHTHSIPFFGYLLLTGLIFYIFSIYYPLSPLIDRFIFAIFFLTTSLCMGFSTGYHTLMSHSKRVAGIWLRLDFLGIVVAILGDFVTGIYVAFYCEWKMQVGYWVMVFLSFSVSRILILPLYLLFSTLSLVSLHPSLISPIHTYHAHPSLDHNPHLCNPRRALTPTFPGSTLAYFPRLYIYRNRLLGFRTNY